MPFDRLLSVAVLTPAQAVLVAVQLLDAADMSGGVDGEPGQIDRLGAATLTPTGVLDVARPHSDAGTHVRELLRQLLQNARRLPAHPRPEQVQLLHALEEAVRDPLLQPGMLARELEGALADALGPNARRRVSAQLASLVDAFARVTPNIPEPAEVAIASSVGPVNGAAKAPPPSQTAPARPPSSRPPRRTKARLRPRRRGRRVAIVALVVAAVLAVSGYVLMGRPGFNKIPFIGGGDHQAKSGQTPSTQHANNAAHKPKPHHRPAVATMAPRHAGAITGVKLVKVHGCKPGAFCPVKVTVHFHQSSTARPIGWKVGVARLCKPGLTWSAHTAVTTQAGWTKTWAHSTVRIPKGKSLALVAMTTTPARAQSQPVPVTGSSLHC